MMYKITPKKGESYTVNSRHDLVFKIGSDKPYRNLLKDGIVKMTPLEFLSQSQCLRRHLVGFRAPVDFESQYVRIDPYILGCWLGDGTSSNQDITNCDEQVIEAFAHEADNRGLSFHRKGKSITYALAGKAGIAGSNSLLNDLKYYNLINNKHLPHDYKINSRDVRLQILAGSRY